MTSPAPAVGRRYRFSIVRVLLFGVLLSLLTAACLYVYHTAVTFYHARLLDAGKKSIAWFVEQIGYSLPFISICLFHAAVYHRHDRRDGVAQREMLWEVVFVAFFTYGVLLPYMNGLSRDMYLAAVESGATIPETEAGVPWTLMMKLHDWFIRFTVPLLVLTIFHSMRAKREIERPETEVPEELLTVDEYRSRARKAAEAGRIPDETEAQA